MRKIKLSRILILFLIPVCIFVGGLCFFSSKDKQVVDTSYYDLSRFEYKNGLMSYTDSRYKTMTGIDVSSFNKEIDWERVKKDDIDFVMIRCGFRGGEDGILYDDPMYEDYMDGASKAGLLVGVYFYSSAITESELDEEVEYVLNRVKGYSLDFPIAYDMEYYNDAGRIIDLSRKEKTNMALRFCEKIEAAGYSPMVYGNMSWLYNDVMLGKVSQYPIWLASYSQTCTMEDEFNMWQYSSQASVQGIDGVVDINLWIEKK